jgi:hypothetical protein
MNISPTLLRVAGNPNSDTGTLIGIAIMAGIALSVWAIKKTLRNRRNDQWKIAARDIGLKYEGDEWSDRNSAPMMETALFASGNDTECKNITTGTLNGLRVSLLDFSYTLGGYKGSSTTTQTVGAYSKDGVYNPYFEMGPGGAFDKMLNKVTHKNIYFELSPEFSRHYVCGARRRTRYARYLPLPG